MSLGRYSEPSELEVRDAEAVLLAAGSSGWLAVVRGRYYTSRKLEVLAVRPLGSPPADGWPRAVSMFLHRRTETLADRSGTSTKLTAATSAR